MNNDNELEIIKEAKTIAIVGISNKAERDSYKVAAYLKQNGYQIIAVNPMLEGTFILEEQCYSSLEIAKEITGIEIDIVDCFRKSEDIGPIVEQAIKINAKCVWMQLGVENIEAAEKARSKGLKIVMNRCTKIEHKNLTKEHNE